MRKTLLWLCTAIFLFAISWTPAAALDYKFSMSYIYSWNAVNYAPRVDAAQDSLDEVAPNYFALDDYGNLVVTDAVSPDFVSDMHVRGIRVVPYLTNEWDRQVGINALSKKEALVQSLADAVAAYNLDGVNIDLENLTEYQRADYLEFVRLLREKLPESKTIAIAVAANPSGAVKGWAASYDYAGLAEYCDYLMIMAYDEHWDGSQPGSVSSMAFMENSIKYALRYVPREKIVLGLPFYGRIWSTGSGYPQGYGISNTRITQFLADYQSTVYIDSASQSACATITIGASQQKPVVGGKTLTAGTYVIWYENEQTLKEKLGLVQKYGLLGAGSWSLGQEDASTWDYYTLRLNGCTFDDIQNNWARDDILEAYLSGWVDGITPETFDPGAPLTRAQAAAVLVRLLGYPVEDNSDYSFYDTGDSWARDYISTARRYGIVSGDGSNNFAPEGTVTRQEFAVMLQNILSYPAAAYPPTFCDVTPKANPWSYDAIAALSTSGIFTGLPDGSFSPEDNVTRAQMASLLTRLQIG